MAQQHNPGGLRALLYQEVLQLIEDNASLSDEAFNELALRLFRYQLSANPIYRGYYDAGRFSAPNHWKMIPALPAAAFKRAQVCSFPFDMMKHWFQTSGTTEKESGYHYFETLEIYEKAICPPFRRYLLPDKERMRMAFLTGTPEEMPNSSLVHMMETVRRHFGTSESGYYIENNIVNLDALVHNLNDAASSQQPVMLLGTAFGFVHTLEAMAAHGIRFNLPFGSRIMETGGFKGRVREITRDEFYPLLSEGFGIPVFNIVNEYGMTELSSQFYDRSLRDQSSSEWKLGPEWCRVLCVDTETGLEVPYGEPGMLRIYDLANVGSVIALQTEDVGIMAEDGSFRVLGRVGQAQPRGCSLVMEQR